MKKQSKPVVRRKVNEAADGGLVQPMAYRSRRISITESDLSRRIEEAVQARLPQPNDQTLLVELQQRRLRLVEDYTSHTERLREVSDVIIKTEKEIKVIADRIAEAARTALR